MREMRIARQLCPYSVINEVRKNIDKFDQFGFFFDISDLIMELKLVKFNEHESMISKSKSKTAIFLELDQ